MVPLYREHVARCTHAIARVGDHVAVELVESKVVEPLHGLGLCMGVRM
jgi:hypothetical protein